MKNSSTTPCKETFVGVEGKRCHYTDWAGHIIIRSIRRILKTVSRRTHFLPFQKFFQYAEVLMCNLPVFVK